MSLPWCPSILSTHRPSARRVGFLRWGLAPFAEELSQAAQCQPSPPRLGRCSWEWSSSWTGWYSTETKADGFNVMFAWRWAVHMGFVEGNVEQWQGFLWTLQFSPDVRLSKNVPWPTYHRPSGGGGGVGGWGYNKSQMVVTVVSMYGSLLLTQKWDVPGVDD